MFESQIQPTYLLMSPANCLIKVQLKYPVMLIQVLKPKHSKPLLVHPSCVTDCTM